MPDPSTHDSIDRGGLCGSDRRPSAFVDGAGKYSSIRLLGYVATVQASSSSAIRAWSYWTPNSTLTIRFSLQNVVRNAIWPIAYRHSIQHSVFYFYASWEVIWYHKMDPAHNPQIIWPVKASNTFETYPREFAQNTPQCACTIAGATSQQERRGLSTPCTLLRRWWLAHLVVHTIQLKKAEFLLEIQENPDLGSVGGLGSHFYCKF